MRHEKVMMWPLQPTYRRRHACWHQSLPDGDTVALGDALMIQGPVMVLLTLGRNLQGFPLFTASTYDRLRP